MRHRAVLLSFAALLPALAHAAEPTRDSRRTDERDTEKVVASAAELIEMANAMMDFKRFGEAITAYTLALQQEPGNGQALANRALAYAWTNRLEEAAADLAAAEKHLTRSAVLHRVRAILANRRSDQNTELAELTKSLALEPANPFALSFRASIYLQRRQYLAAMTDAEAYIRAQPNEPEAYLMKAEIYGAQRNWPLAVKQAELLRARFSSDGRALAAAADIHKQAGRRAEALALMNQAIALDDGAYYLWTARARIRGLDDFAGRQLDLARALELSPNNLSIIANRGVLDFEQGRWEAAITHFSEILKREPKDFLVLAYRAMAKLQAGNATGAKADYDAALAAASGPGDRHRICNALAVEGVALEWAAASCQSAVMSEPNRAIYRVSRGLTHLRLGRLDDAIADYDQAIAINPDLADAHYGRALALLRKGDTQRAAAARTEALKIKPTVGEVFVAKGLAELEREAGSRAADPLSAPNEPKADLSR